MRIELKSGKTEAIEIEAAFAAIMASSNKKDQIGWRNLGFIAVEKARASIGRHGTEYDAEDIAQQVLESLAKRVVCDDVTIEAPVAYFRKCLRNACYRFVRRHRRDPLGGKSNMLDERFIASAPTPESDRQRTAVRRAMTELRVLLARTGNKVDAQMYMAFLRGVSNVDLARRFHVSESTVSRRLRNISRALRECIEKEVID